MRLAAKLKQLGFCVARVAEEREEYTWERLPKSILVHGIEFTHPSIFFVIDSFAGGRSIQFKSADGKVRLEIMRDHQMFSVVQDLGDKGSSIYSYASQKSGRWTFEEALATIKADRKLQRKLNQLELLT